MTPAVFALALPLLAALAAAAMQRQPEVRLATVLACLGLSVFLVAVLPADAAFPVLGGTALVRAPLDRLLLAVLHAPMAALAVAGWRSRGSFLAYALVAFAAAAGSLSVDSPFVAVLLLQAGALVAVLVLAASDRPGAPEALARYLTLVFFGGVLLLVGLTLVEGFQASAENQRLAQALTAILILGFAIRLAAPPLHLWLPELAATGPPLGVGLVVTVLALPTYGLAVRLFAAYPSVLLSPTSSGLLMAGSAVAVGLATLLLAAQRDLGRLLGFAASYAAAYALLGIALANAAGLVGGLLQAVAAAPALALLAVSASAIERATGTAQIARLAGIARTLPFSAAGLLIALLSLAGLPPFAGFAGLRLLLEAAARRGPGWAVVLLVCSALAIAYLAVVAQRLLFGGERQAEAKPETWETRAAIATLGAALLLLGLFPQPVINALVEAVARFPLARVS